MALTPFLKHLLGPGIDIGSREKSRVTRLFIEGRTLDVGCGNGYYTRQASLKGPTVGLTIHPEELVKCEVMRDYLRSKERVLCCKFQDFTDSLGFDQILMLDILEHIKDDRAALKHAHELLNEDGYLFISVPNRDFEVSRANHTWRYETGWHMRHGYTFEQLERLLEESGFEPIDRRRYGTFGSCLALKVQKHLTPIFSAITFPLLRLLSFPFWWSKPHTILVIARKV